MADLQKSYKIVFPVIFDSEALRKEKNIRLKFAVADFFSPLPIFRLFDTIWFLLQLLWLEKAKQEEG